MAAVPVVLSTSQTPRHEDAVRLDLRRLLQISPTGTVVCLASGLASGSFWSLAPVFTAGISHTASLAAAFMTGAVLGGAAGQWPLGYWSDRVDRRIVIAVLAFSASVVGTLMWLLYAVVSETELIVLSAAWGALAFPLYSIAVAHSNDFAKKGEYVMVSAGLLLMYGMGAIIGPFLAASAMTLVADSVLYLYTAIIHLLAFGYVLFRVGRRAPVPMAEHVPFSDALTTVQTASQVFEEELEDSNAPQSGVSF